MTEVSSHRPADDLFVKRSLSSTRRRPAASSIQLLHCPQGVV